MSTTERATNIRLNNPGPLDAWEGPYNSIAEACTAIPNVVKDGVNFRLGKKPLVRINDKLIPYWWPETDFSDAGLVTIQDTSQFGYRTSPTFVFTGGKLQLTGGIVNDTTFGYGISEYQIPSGGILDIHVDIGYSVNSGLYAIAALYNGTVWVKDLIISEVGKTTYDAKYRIPDSGINKLVIITRNERLRYNIVSASARYTDDNSLTNNSVTTPKIVDNAVSTAKIADGSITVSKLASDFTDNIIGKTVKLTSSAERPGYLMLAGGVLQTTTYNYDVLEFSVNPLCTLKVHAYIGSAVSSSIYPIVSLYNGNTWVADALFSTAGILDYDVVVELPSNVNKVFILSFKNQHAKTIVLQTAVTYPRPLSAAALTDGAITNQKLADSTIEANKISEAAKYEMTGKVTKISPTLAFTKYLQRTNGLLVETPYGFNIYSANINTECLVNLHIDIGNGVNSSIYSIVALYNDDTWVRDLIISTAATVYDMKFIVPPGVNKLLFFCASSKLSSCIVSMTSQFRIYSSNDVLPSISTIIQLPSVIYGLLYNGATLNILNRIYPEGILTQKINDCKINGQNSCFVDSTATTEGDVNITLEISGTGYAPTTKNVKLRRVNASKAQNKTIRLMCIGDSLTYGGYPAVAELLFKALNQDLGSINVLMVGTMVGNLPLTLDKYTFTNRSCHEGRGGFAVSDYLRHFTVTRARYFTGSQLGGKAAWDSLGLGTMTRNGVPGRSYETFVYSQAIGELIRSTCHGYYDADPTPELWDWIVNKLNVHSFTYNTVTYTFGASYSNADDEAQKAYIKYCCENPSIPFFDIETVNSSNGQYAFNMQKYLDRYKTIDEDGVTRLAVGSTAGSKVTNANMHDVLEPTHVVIIMNENDGNQIDSGIPPATDMLLLGTILKEHNSNVKVTIGSTRRYGAINPANYQGVGFLNTFDNISTRHLQTFVTLRDQIGSTYPQFDFLPLYSIQSVVGSGGGKAYDTLDLAKKVRFNSDGLHANTPLEYLDRAYQVVSWLIGTL